MTNASGPDDDRPGDVERRISDRTGGRVRDLKVEFAPGTVTLRGWAPTYYARQRAHSGVVELCGSRRVVNAIEVG